MGKHWLGLVVFALLLGGCSECENGFKVKTEYKYVMGYEYWHESPKDEFLDGAVRVSTSSHKSGRTLTVRCFKPSTDAGAPKLDIRYVITAPLLRRIVPELEKGVPIEMVLSVDGTPVGNMKVRPVSHDFGISFLGDISTDFVDRISAAGKSIVVMPRKGSEKLDDVIEFGVAELGKHIKPVKNACGKAPSVPVPVKSQSTKT